MCNVQRCPLPSILSVCIGLSLSLLSVPRAYAAQFINTACGYRVTYPDSWNAVMHPDGRNLVLLSFPLETMPPGELFAPGGARITIQMFPPYTNPRFRQGDDDDSMLTALVRNKTVISRTSARSGKPARLTTSLFDVRSVATVIHREGRVFVFMLDCGTDDPQCPGEEQVLDGVIASITFSGSTSEVPAPTPSREVCRSARRAAEAR